MLARCMADHLNATLTFFCNVSTPCCSVPCSHPLIVDVPLWCPSRVT